MDGSQVLSVSTFGPEPGKLIVILPVDENAQKLRDDVVVQREFLNLRQFFGLGVLTIFDAL